MKRASRFILIVLVLFFWVNYCLSHHALEYIEMESSSTAAKGWFVFHLHLDYMVDDKDNPRLDHWEYTPGLAYGITDRLMIDVHTHFAKFGVDHVVDSKKSQFEPYGPPPFMEAVAFALQYQITKDFPVDISAAAVYELPFSRSKKLLDGKRVIKGILIMSKTFSNHANMTANLTFGKDGDETIKEWALGAKVPISRDPNGISAGVELLGDFEGNLSVLGGIYFPLDPAGRIMLKTGIEIGKNSMRGNGTLMYLF
jgi:hypothetical protein